MGAEEVVRLVMTRHGLSVRKLDTRWTLAVLLSSMLPPGLHVLASRTRKHRQVRPPRVRQRQGGIALHRKGTNGEVQLRLPISLGRQHASKTRRFDRELAIGFGWVRLQLLAEFQWNRTLVISGHIRIALRRVASGMFSMSCCYANPAQATR